ncbi:MAG: mechanosensitive ion channel, partial [Firmicutes bacterium]|nr:mechanosensitive ion channel [Bacillota bacterium]
LDVDNAGFRLVEGDELVLAGLAGTARETMRRPRLRIGESFSGKVVAEGRTLMVEAGSVPDMVAEHRDREQALGYTHYLGVPLRVGNRITGTLAFRARRPFTERDRELAEAFAGQAAIALEHARLYREASRQAAENARLLALETQRRNQIETLAALERELAAELNPGRLLYLIVNRARDLLGAEGIIYLAQEDRTLTPSARTEGAFADQRIPFGLGLVGACAQERRGLLANDYPASPYARPRFVALGVRHGIVQPLLLRDRLLGVVGMFRFGDGPPPFTEDELDTLGQLANQAAMAVENAQLYDETERRRREAEELASLARRLTETLDLREVCDRVVENAPALFGAATAGIWLLQPDGTLVARAYSGDRSDIMPVGYILEPGVGVAGRAVVEGRPVASTDVLEDPAVVVSEDLRRRVEATGNRAVLATPLKVKGRTIGALVVADPVGRVFSAQETVLFQALAELGPATSAELAARAGVDERYTREWLACLAAAVALVLAWLSGKLWDRLVGRLAARTSTDFDEKMVQVSHRPMVVTVFLLTLNWGLEKVSAGAPGVGGEVLATAGQVLFVLIVLALAVWVDFLVRTAVEWYSSDYASRTQGSLDQFLPLVRQLSRILIYFLALTIILEHFNVNITGLVATAGVASLAVALAAQETLSNMFAGLMIMLDRPFRPGDRIELDKGLVGDVLTIGTRTTRILTLDNTVIVVPNKELANSRIINYVFPTPRVSLKLTIGVAYDTDLQAVKDILRGILAGHPDVLEDPAPGIYFTSFGDFALIYTVICWIPDYRQKFRIADEINTAVKERFDAAGIEIPYPKRDIAITSSALRTALEQEEVVLPGRRGGAAAAGER